MWVESREDTLPTRPRSGETTAILRLFLVAMIRLDCRGDPKISDVDLVPSVLAADGMGLGMRIGSFRLWRGEARAEEAMWSLKERERRFQADLLG